MDKAPQWWYNKMNEFWVEKKLETRPDLERKFGRKYKSFCRFCLEAYKAYGWQGFDSLIEEFENETFFGMRFQRLQDKNVKKWKKLREQVFLRDGYICSYCGQRGGFLEVDHVYPFSKGGTDDIDNLATACRRCNRQKRDKTIEEFLEWRKNNELE